MTAARTAFIVNRHAGAGLGAERLAGLHETMARLANGGPIEALDGGAQIDAAVRRALAADCGVVVAGGGDGTLGCVAGPLVGRGVALGVLPLGTLNHFARDLGIPLEPEAALATIADGNIHAVDVADVNGRFFLNNSSLGLYPEIVHERELQQARLGRGKWPAFAWATLAALRRYPFLDARLSADEREQRYRTPFIFVGNNAYRMDGLRIGARNALDQGVLSVCVAQRTGRWGLVRLAFRALFGHLREAKDFRAMLAKNALVETRHPRLRVANDGEVCLLDTPLHYRIHE
ncbi:MAG TPA: diacylglycerol kinase family protein, partial [Albitalea sp.]|nr:diacylglycerol kinase family protein [Albitalea sp.]